MLEKIKSYQTHPRIAQLKDVRMLGFLVFLVIVLLVSYSGVSVIQSNFELEKRVSKLQQEIQVASIRNENLKLTNEYYKSDQYLELQARKQYNMGLPGETLLLVPKNIAYGYVRNTPTQTAAQSKPVSKKPQYQQNFEAWRAFLSHQRPTSN